MQDVALDQLADEAVLGRLPMLYARAVDHRDVTLFLSIFTEDAVLQTPVNRWQGHAALAAIPTRLDSLYQSTLHSVANRTVSIAGHHAEGETYCIAYHLYRPEDGVQKRCDWAIRYQDTFVRQAGVWRFSRRQLIIDWTRTTTGSIPPK